MSPISDTKFSTNGHSANAIALQKEPKPKMGFHLKLLLSLTFFLILIRQQFGLEHALILSVQEN